MPEKTKTTRKETKEVLKYFYQKSLPYKGKTLICIGCTILCTLLGVYTPILTADLTDTISQYGMIERDTMYEDLLQIVFLIGICWAVQVILRNVILYLYTKVTLQGTTDIQDENIYFLTHSSYRFLTDQQSWEVYSKLNMLAQNFCTFFGAVTDSLLDFCLTIPITIWIIFSKDVMLGVWFLLFWIAYFFGHYWFYHKCTSKYEKSAEAQSKQNGFLYDVLTNMINILTLWTCKREIQNRNKYRKDWVDAQLEVRKFKTKRNLLLGIIAVIFEIGSVFLAVKLRYNGEVEISTIVLVLMFVGRFVGQLSIIPNIIDDVSRIMGESKKPLEILNTPHEIVDKTEKKIKSLSLKNRISGHHVWIF